MVSKKRILILNYEFPPLGGGASPVSCEIAKGYAKLGHRVDVVTMHYEDLPFFEEKDGMNIYRVKCLRSKKEICHPWEQLTYVNSAKKFLKKHLKKNSYDICHCHFIIPTGIVALWVKKKFGIPYIITSHGSDVLGYNNKRAFKYIYPLVSGKWKKIVKEAKMVISPSKFLLTKINNITKDGNFLVINNGIDANKFKPMKKEKKILVVARLFENKGVQTILDALKGLDMKGWKVDIVGEGPYREFLENKIKENNLGDIVTFHGWIDNNSRQMKELYGKASIFISASWFESFGLTLLEAMQSECYLLVSGIPAYKQFDLDEKNYFELNNSDELSDRLNELINTSKIKTKKFDKKFELDNIIKKYGEIL